MRYKAVSRCRRTPSEKWPDDLAQRNCKLLYSVILDTLKLSAGVTFKKTWHFETERWRYV